VITSRLPAACLACMMAATFSLSRCCSLPDLLLAFFYSKYQYKVMSSSGARLALEAASFCVFSRALSRWLPRAMIYEREIRVCITVRAVDVLVCWKTESVGRCARADMRSEKLWS
jgi:hypothetical protein